MYIICLSILCVYVAVISFDGKRWTSIFTDISIHSNVMQAKHSYLELCCASALQCSLQLNELRTEVLTTHVGITCGDMQFSSLGGYQNKWYFVLTGEIITMLSSCMDDEPSHQVCVSSDVYMNLSNIFSIDQLNATPTESNNYTIKSEVEEDMFTFHAQLPNRFQNMCKEAAEVKVMKSFVPPHILHAIMKDTLDAISELRTVTTVSIRILGDDFNISELMSLQQLVVKVQNTLHEAGGFLQSFLINDDEGLCECVLTAMWGVPSFTFEDNTSRAVLFSYTIHKQITDFGKRCSIGVTTGRMFCGIVGSAHRCLYVGIGPQVRRAARLCDHAGLGVLVEDETFDSVDEKTEDMLPGIVRTMHHSMFTDYESTDDDDNDKVLKQKGGLLKRGCWHCEKTCRRRATLTTALQIFPTTVLFKSTFISDVCTSGQRFAGLDGIASS